MIIRRHHTGAEPPRDALPCGAGPARALARTSSPMRRRAALLSLAALLLGVGASLAAMLPVAAVFTASGAFPGLGNGHIWSLAVSPADANLVLAGTDNGVYRSTDGAATWKQTSLRGVRVWTVGWDARDPHPAFAGLDSRGVMRSEDGGNQWADDSQGLTDLDVRCLAFSLEGVAAGTRSGVDVSGDGHKWRTAGLDGYSVSSLAVAANQPQLTLIAGVDAMPTNSTGYLFRNSGGGLQWETLQQGLPASAVVSALAAGPLPATGQPRPLAVTTTKGSYRSGDGGTTWSPSGGVPDQVNLTTVAFSPADPNLVYTGADAGGSTGGAGGAGGALLRSTDGGGSFAAVADALPDGHRNVEALAIQPLSPPVVLAAVDPPNAAPAVYRGQDSAAPASGGTGSEQPGSALPAVVATPKPKATAKAAPHATPATAQSTGIRHVAEVVVRFPFPLMLELFAIVVIGYLVLRWRQRYLDVEGPP